MKFSKLGSALVVSTVLSQGAFAKGQSNSEQSSTSNKWINGAVSPSVSGHNNHNHNNNHNGGNNHQSYKVNVETITSSMLS